MNNLEKINEFSPKSSISRPFQRARVGGCPVDVVSFQQGLAFLEENIKSGNQVKVGCVNAAKIAAAQKDSRLRQALEACELVLADGMPVVWAARALGIPIPERSAGIDMMHALLNTAQRLELGVFLLGAREAVLVKTVENLQRVYSGIKIVGFQHGYFNQSDLPQILVRINSSGAQLLFVALGTPQKEIWIDEHAKQLKPQLIMGVGGSFDVIAGVKRRAPQWMQTIGMEWLWRLALEPRRMAKRYLIGNTVFVKVIIKDIFHHWRVHYQIKGYE